MAEYIERSEIFRVWKNIPFPASVTSLSAAIHQTPAADVAPVRHGRWTYDPDSIDGFTHHMCTVCKTDAVFDYTYEDDYDEWLDGELKYIGQREAGILEHLTGFCPNCGAKMDLEAQV